MNETSKRVLRHIECCIETGNHDAARIMLDEYIALDPAQAELIQQQLQLN